MFLIFKVDLCLRINLSVIDLVVRETNYYAYFGICIIMGINSLPRISIFDSFIGNSSIQNVLTKNRFEEISHYIHFNDYLQELPRDDDNYDRLFKVHPIHDNILEKIQNVFEPFFNLSIDKGMTAFKGRLSFRQYMPTKPTKYGIEVWMAADSSNGYVSNFLFTLGTRQWEIAFMDLDMTS